MADQKAITPGSIFGQVTVLSLTRPRYWRCRCVCGEEFDVRVDALRRHTARSCVCLKRKATTNRNRTHGLSHIPEYMIWSSMKNRCENPRDKAFPNYGGRGIKVCVSFLEFIDDVGPRPSPQHSIERISNDRGYEKGNMKWATRLEQNNNQRTNIKLTFNGETHNLGEWARILNIPRNRLETRLLLGWSVDRALTEPRHMKQTLTFNGVTRTVAEWALAINANYEALASRLLNGWSVERALTQRFRKSPSR